jgi:hypothetical protein
MAADSLDHWLEALAGHEGAGAIEGGSVEGRALRSQIRAQPPEALVPVAELDAAREAQLIARARAAGLLPADTADTARGRSTVRSRWGLPQLALLATSLAVAAVAILTLRNPMHPSETLRGVVNGTVELEARDPRALKQALIQELQAAGVTVTGYEQLDRVGLDAELPMPLAPKVRRVLEQHHIPVPSDGALVIEIRRAVAP